MDTPQGMALDSTRMELTRQELLDVSVYFLFCLFLGPIYYLHV